MGERIAARPWICIGAVLLVTLMAFTTIATNGISFEMDQEEMTPDTDAYNADKLLRDVFRFEQSSINLLRADDALSKESFLAGLEYEKRIFEDPVASGYLLDTQMPQTSFNSPYSALISAMVFAEPSETPILPPPPGFDPNDPDHSYHDVLLAYVEYYDEGAIKENATALMAMDRFSEIKSLFTEDLDLEKGTASGAMMIAVLDRNKVLADDEMDFLQYEEAVAGIADEVNEDFFNGDGQVNVFDEHRIVMDMADVADSDLETLFPLALLVMVAILMLMYRDPIDMLVAISCLVFAIMWTFGAALVFGIGISTISIAVPILVLGLGIDYALHLVFRYRDERGDGNDNFTSASNAVGSVGEALLLATITTVIAFLSNVTSSMKMIADFGVLSAIGIISSFIIMILVIPSVQSVRDQRYAAKGIKGKEVRRYRKRTVDSNDIIGKVSMLGGKLAISKPLAVIVAGGLVMGGFGYFAANVSYEFDVFDFLPEDSESNEMLTFIFDEFEETGQNTAEILIYGDPTEPEMIRAIESSVDNMKDARHMAFENGEPDVMHIGTALHAIYQQSEDASFKANYSALFDPDTGRVLEGTDQDDIELLIQELSLKDDDEIDLMLARVIGGSEEHKDLSRMQLGVEDNLPDSKLLELREDLQEAVAPLEDAGYEAVPTGMLIANAVIMDEMQNDQMTSLLVTLALTLIVLTVAMFLLTRSVLLGALATLPTVMSVIMVWGSMYLMDIPLNVMTLTIAALTVGIGVTYGIHIAHRFSSEMGKGLSPEEAVMVTTGATGRGVLGAALTTAVGFGILNFSSMVPLAQFGLITAMAIAYAYIGATVALPTLLVIWGRRRHRAGA